MAATRLRILGVGDGRSIIFLRWAWRLAELGHDVHIVSDRITDRPGELDAITAHQIQNARAGHAHQGRPQAPLRAAPSATWRPRLDVDLVHAHYLLPYGYWAAEAGVHPLVMSPWNTDIFTYGRDSASGDAAGWRRRSPAATHYVVSSIGNADETVRLGADRRPRCTGSSGTSTCDRFCARAPACPGLAARFGWQDDSLVDPVAAQLPPQHEPGRAAASASPASRREEPRRAWSWPPEAAGSATRPTQLLDEPRSCATGVVAASSPARTSCPELCASADIGISIASTDATPASMIESMASGLPMVMGDAITIDEWITQGEGGEVVDCRDDDAVTAALLQADPRCRRCAARYGERNARVTRERLPPPGPALVDALPRHARPRMRVLVPGHGRSRPRARRPAARRGPPADAGRHRPRRGATAACARPCPPPRRPRGRRS